KYINPFTDFGFKKLFGTEPNKDLLIDFLNQVILPKRRQITDLTYKKTEHLGATEFDRKAIFDLYCIGSNNERFIVEMQKAKQKLFQRPHGILCLFSYSRASPTRRLEL
ncbi:MAG: PD-(D/E)XK nuclease family transposase, partial [Saprospiraceae bacterium]|nr:PD-(D/E)XK nuclease family transposase [Saprospiraceae bacterium]